MDKGAQMRCCDNCKYYGWYYDFCDKWKCEVDAQSCCSEHSRRKEEERSEDDNDQTVRCKART